NLRATANEISVQFLKKDHGHSVHVVCSGTEGSISLEDSLLAGALTSWICGLSINNYPEGMRLGNDEAMMVLSQWLEVERYAKSRPLSALLEMGRGGQNVQRIGLAADIDAAARVDTVDLVVELQRDPLRIVAV